MAIFHKKQFFFRNKARKLKFGMEVHLHDFQKSVEQISDVFRNMSCYITNSGYFVDIVQTKVGGLIFKKKKEFQKQFNRFLETI